MNKKIFIFNFTDVYLNEKFYNKDDYKIINLDSLDETRYVCSKANIEKLRKICDKVDLNAIHFIDSGDYHYLTKFFIDKIDYDFTLIIFDHHSDMQHDMLDSELTCGNWVNHILNLKHLKKIILIGPQLNDLKELSHEKLYIASSIDEINKIRFQYPVYISIDKDCLSKKEVDTNWDQGDMKTITLLNAIEMIFNLDNVIGVDICGECDELVSSQILKKDNYVNLELVQEIDKHIK